MLVPQRDRFVLAVEWDDLVGDQPKNRRLQARLPAGEFAMELIVYQRSRGDWRLLIAHFNGSTETPIADSTVADLSQRSFSMKIARGETFIPEPFERLVLLEQFDPEATLFGGAV